MLRPRTPNVMVALMIAQALASGPALAQWRTPPALANGSNFVTCALLNNSGAPISISNYTFTVQTATGDFSEVVASAPGVVTVNDGRGIGGTSVFGLQFSGQVVYCELNKDAVLGTTPDKVMFTMSINVGANAMAVTQADPASYPVAGKKPPR